MKKIYSVFILLLVTLSLKAASQKIFLEGKVTDTAGAAIPGAIIYFADLKKTVVSDINGNYHIDNLPQGKFLVQVKMEGFKSVFETIELGNVTHKDFVLHESITEIEEVVITGISKATEFKKNPVPMVFIDQKFILQNTGTNAIDVIAKIPGVSALSTGPNVSKPYIRGLGYNRVLTLFDGVRQEGQQWGDEHGIEIDQFLVDRVEVIKGPASLMYGSDALAGVVNLLPSNPLPMNSVTGNLLTNYQTNNGQYAGSLSMAGNNKGFVWGIRGSMKRASTYQNKYDGRVYGTKYNESDFNAYLGLNKSWGYSHLNFSLYDNLQEIPDGSRDSSSRKFTKRITEAGTSRPIVSDAELRSYDIAVIHQHVQHYRIYSSNNFILGKSRLLVNLGFQQNARREFSHPSYPDLPGLHLILNTYTYDIKYHLPEWNEWETTLGANGMYQLNTNSGTEFLIPDYKLFDVGPFMHMKKSFGRLDIAAGLRYDIRSFSNDSMFTRRDPATGFDMQTPYSPSDTAVVRQFSSYAHTFNGLSASIGATYNINEKFCVKANVARGYRAPNPAEISARGVHPGTGFLQLGDEHFKPEFSLQEDIGLFFSSRHISGNMELFNNNISNYIYDERLTGALGADSIAIIGGVPYPVFKFRQTNAQLYGGEFSLDIHPHPLDWLHFENSVSFIYGLNLGGNGALITDTTKYLPLILPLHTSTELRADIKRGLKYFSGLFIKFGVQYYAAQNQAYLAYRTETKTPGYVLLDAGIGGSATNKKGDVLFSFYIIGTNLADVAYQSNMSRLKYMDNYPVNGTGRSGIYNMGRNISFKLVIPITIKKAA